MQNNERINNLPLDVDKIDNKGRQQAFNSCNFTSDFLNKDRYKKLNINLLYAVLILFSFNMLNSKKIK